MQTAKRLKDTLALTVVVLLCTTLFSLLLSGLAGATPGDTVRASTSTAEVQGNSHSYYPSISSDGRYVAFTSDASNMIVGWDTNGVSDVFRKDLTTGETVLVSTDWIYPGNNPSLDPSISSDGRYVAFRSFATDLVTPDTYANSDIFRKDLTTGSLLRVSTSSSGVQGNGNCYDPSISSDGKYVAFASSSNNLTGEDGNDVRDVFRKDLTTGQTVLASTSSSGVQGKGDSNDPSISSDGRYVAFFSDAYNLVDGGGDTNGVQDVFRKDLATGSLVRVSTSSSGAQGLGGNSNNPSMSPDGRYVAFASNAINLLGWGGDTNIHCDIFRKDLTTGQILLVSTSSFGVQGLGESYQASIGIGGCFVAFESNAANLVSVDTNNTWDVFRKDLDSGQTVRVSTSSSGAQGNSASYHASISPDNTYVAFDSYANNLAGLDTNNVGDVFRKDVVALPSPSITSISPTSGVVGTTVTINGAHFDPSGGGSYVKFGDKKCATGDYVSWSETQVKAKVPSGATGTVAVTLTAAGGVSNSKLFTVTVNPVLPKPSISSMTPSSGPVGTTVDIKGADFGFSQGTSYVTFNGEKAASYPSWSNTQIKVKVPSGATTGLVNVTTPGGASNGKTFTVTVLEPKEEPKPAQTTPSTWYLAEGSTKWGFSTYITIENPNDKQVKASVTYNTESGAVKGPGVTLPAMSQATINPADVVGEADFSTVVACNEGETIAVDRTMTWKQGTAGASARKVDAVASATPAPEPTPPPAQEEAHSSVGVTSPAKTWYLPEGSSKWGFECWLLIQNPNTKEATCTITYMIEGAAPRSFTEKVPANSRKTYSMASHIGAADASIEVSSNVPVIPERAMYRNNRREGHDSIGTTTPAEDYYLAEGTTNYGFTTYVLIQNPNDSANEVTLTYMTEAGPSPQEPFTMEPNSRKTVRVNDALSGADFSTRVNGKKPIIAERAMYWHGGEDGGEACHDSIGMSAPHACFYLPDGQTSDGRETYTLIQNPNASSVKVRISYLNPTGEGNATWTETIGANSRRTFSMADKRISGRAAVLVESLTSGKEIMVERAMYWNNRGAGTDTIGGCGD